jgi:hypothetical protein
MIRYPADEGTGAFEGEFEENITTKVSKLM